MSDSDDAREARRASFLKHALIRDDDFREVELGRVDPDRVKAMRTRIEAMWARREEQLAGLSRNARVHKFSAR